MSAQTYDTRLGRKFAELVKARQDQLTSNVMQGMYSEREYAKETGRVRGLEEALELYVEAEAFVRKAAERS